MTDVSPLSGLDTATGEASGALASLAAPAQQAASAIDQAFSKAGDSLARSIASAATSGKLSLADLAKAAIAAVDALAGASSSSVGGAAGGLGAALGSALGSVLTSVFGGARADGGPVSAGGAYLVGERGPEVFRPSTGGDIGAVGSTAPQITVQVQATAGPAAFVRSEAQLAQALARAVSLGVRR